MPRKHPPLSASRLLRHVRHYLGKRNRCSSIRVRRPSVRGWGSGENIYGPYEAGFTSQQDFILEGLGCSPGSLGHLSVGIDTKTAEAMVAHQCGITLPRYDAGSYVSLLVIIAPHLSVMSSRIGNNINSSSLSFIGILSHLLESLSFIGNPSPPHSSVTFSCC